MAEIYRATPTSGGWCFVVGVGMSALALGAGAGLFMLARGDWSGAILLVGSSGSYLAVMVLSDLYAQIKLAYYKSVTAANQPFLSFQQRDIPNLSESEAGVFHSVAATNLTEGQARAILTRLPARNLVNPPVPKFVTVSQVARVAYDYDNNRGFAFTYGNYAGRDDAGNSLPFGGGQFRRFREWMLEQGFVERVDDRKNSAVQVTQAGALWLRSVIMAYPSAWVKTYRYKR